MGPENKSIHFLFYGYELAVDDGRNGKSYGQEQNLALMNVSGRNALYVFLVSRVAEQKDQYRLPCFSAICLRPRTPL